MVSAWLGVLAVIVASPDSAAAPAPVASPEPPIRITLNHDGYYDHGDRAKVKVRIAEDGYLVVLRADVDGRVRVLFPLDPGDDDFVRGGKEYEVRGRGDREAFYVDDRDGTGTILAATSASPFHYDRFVRGDHWDYRVLADERVVDRVRTDPEGELVDLVTAMADSEPFDYDVARYTVGMGVRQPYYSYYGYPCYGCYGPRLRLGFYFGSYRYCDPFLYDPFFCDSFFYDAYYPGFYRPYYYQPYGYSCFGNPFCYGYYGRGYPARSAGGFVFKRPVPQPPLVLPRRRTLVTAASAVDRSTRRGVEEQPSWPVEPRRRPAVEPSRGAEGRRATPAAEPRSRGNERPRDWSSRPRSTPRSAGPSRGASPSRGSSSRGSAPSRGSGSRPSNGGGRRH